MRLPTLLVIVTLAGQSSTSFTSSSGGVSGGRSLGFRGVVSGLRGGLRTSGQFRYGNGEKRLLSDH